MRTDPGVSEAEVGAREARLMLGPLRDDIRQTLRVPWLDPGMETAARDPLFFAAAWSAIRPSIGRSFLALARALRDQAAEAVSAWPNRANLVKRAESELGSEPAERITEAARAAHLAASKLQIV